MTKPRRADGRIVPRVEDGGREVGRAELLKRYRGSDKKELMDPELSPSYVLKQVKSGLVETVAKEEAGAEEKGLSIVGLMKREHFDRATPRRTTGHGFFETLAKKGRQGLGIERGNRGDVLDALTFAYRYDGQHGFTISPPASRPFLAALGGYVLPKLNVMPSGPERHWSVEGLFTPSASRTFDWYVSAGPEWIRPLGEDGYDTRFAGEGGLRFRFRIPKLGFMGGRLGLRTTGFRKPHDPRLIFEFGPGAF
ncbi:MAG: hypothetical protein ABR563_16210 [Pyrinomonadaceae bacterium]